MKQRTSVMLNLLNNLRRLWIFSLLAMSVQASYLGVINNEDLVLVSDVLEFICSCAINVGRPLIFESDVTLRLHVCFCSTHAVSHRGRVEQKLIVKLGFVYFRSILEA